MKLSIKLIFIMSFITVSELCFCQNSSRIIYEADENGNKLNGNKNQLLEHVRNGSAIRVGWIIEFKKSSNVVLRLEHWCDAGFLSIIENELFAQIRPISQQNPKFTSPPEVQIVGDKINSWVAVICTNGSLEQKYTNNVLLEKIRSSLKAKGLSEEEIQNQMNQFNKIKVKTKWAILQ
ncbi:MAG: hypothetical protein Wins2KO_13030 [Winogradskyella sp.]